MSDGTSKLLRLAGEARSARRFAAARAHLAEAVAQLRKDGTRTELAQTIRALGEKERALKDRAAACLHYEEAVALYRRTEDTLRLAHTIRHLGDLHHETGRAELAEPCYQEALALYRGHENPPAGDLANAIRPLAVLKAEAGEDEQAIRLLREARDLYESANVKHGVAGCSARLALLSQRQGAMDEAHRWLNHAMAAAEASGDPDSVRYVNTVKSQIDDS